MMFNKISKKEIAAVRKIAAATKLVSGKKGGCFAYERK